MRYDDKLKVDDEGVVEESKKIDWRSLEVDGEYGGHSRMKGDSWG